MASVFLNRTISIQIDLDHVSYTHIYNKEQLVFITSPKTYKCFQYQEGGNAREKADPT